MQAHEQAHEQAHAADEKAYPRIETVRWIDAKNYVYYGSALTARSLARQAARYTAAFGPGAMVFSGGRACGSTFPGAPLLLDAAGLDPALSIVRD